MIYIFQGVQGICSLPGMACRACGDCCAKMNCKPIMECCNACGKGCTHFMERPLSTYVIVSILMGGAAVYMGQGNIVVQVFGIVNILFAFYFQYKVWQRIMEMKETFVEEEAKGPGMRQKLAGGIAQVRQGVRGEQGEEAPPTDTPAADKGKMRVPRETVQAAFKKVFLEDLVVLGFFLALLGMVAYSFQSGTSWGSGFFGVAFIYAFSWYCCKCCAGTVQVEKDEGYSEVPPEA